MDALWRIHPHRPESADESRNYVLNSSEQFRREEAVCSPYLTFMRLARQCLWRARVSDRMRQACQLPDVISLKHPRTVASRFKCSYYHLINIVQYLVTKFPFQICTVWQRFADSRNSVLSSSHLDSLISLMLIYLNYGTFFLGRYTCVLQVPLVHHVYSME